MKKYNEAYLFSSNDTQLSEILLTESMGDVIWSVKEDFYIHYLIANHKISLLKQLKPYHTLGQDVLTNKHNGIGLLHQIAIYATSDDILDVLIPIADAAIDQNPSLLLDRTSNGLHPIAISINENNARISTFFMDKFAQKITQNNAFENNNLAFQLFFTIKNEDGTESSLYQRASKTTGIAPELMNLIEQHGARLFEISTTEKDLVNTPFNDTGTFKSAVLGIGGASSVLSLAQSKQYWSLLLESLQHINPKDYAKFSKFVALQNSINGQDDIPSANDDIKAMQQLSLYLSAAQSKIINDIEAYDANHRIKRFSKNYKKTKDSERFNQLSKRLDREAAKVECVLVLAAIVATIIYLAFDIVKDNHKIDDVKNELIQNNSTDCVYEIDNSLCPHINDSSECDDKMDEINQLIHECKEAAHERSSNITGIILSIVAAVLSPCIVIITNDFILAALLYILEKAVITTDKLLGAYDLSGVIEQNKDLVEAHLLLLKAFEKCQISKDDVAEPIDSLSKPINQVTIDDIHRAEDVLNQLIQQYSDCVKYFPMEKRVSLNDLTSVLGAYSKSTLLNASDDQNGFEPAEQGRQMMPLLMSSTKHSEKDVEKSRYSMKGST